LVSYSLLSAASSKYKRDSIHPRRQQFALRTRARTYFNASSGWQLTRFFDISGTSRTIAFGESIPDPFNSLDFELGVHGTPYKGFWYDVGFNNRTETQNIGNTDFIILNTASTRNRGLEGELSYDFLPPFQRPPLPELQPELGKAVVEAGKATHVPGVLPGGYHPFTLIAFSNVQFLDATYIESSLLVPVTNRTLVGNTSAYAPDFLLKDGILFQKEHCFDIALTAVYVSQQFWQDTDIGEPGNPESAYPCLQCLQPCGRLVHHEKSAFNWWHLQSDRREILQSRICQWNRTRAAPVRLRRRFVEVLTIFLARVESLTFRS
jgi:hypothetical protein